VAKPARISGMPTSFVHLHNHTEFSLLDGAQSIPKLVSRAKDFEMPAVAMTDHGNLFGAVKFYQHCKKEGVRPIIGCEVYVAPMSRFDRTPKQGRHGKPYYHLILLAMNNEGFSNLIKLASLAYLEGFYYKPRIDKALMREYSKGLIATSGCLSGEVAMCLRNDDSATARSAVEEAVEIFGEENYYLELQDQGIEIEKQVNEGLLALHRETGLPLIATNDTHFLCRGDHAAHDVLVCIGTGKKRDDPGRMQYSTEHYFKSPEEMAEVFSWVPEALSNTVTLAERCEVELDMSRHHVPDFPVPKGEDLVSTFRKTVHAGFEERRSKLEALAAEGALRHPLKDYETRLEIELETIIEMGFPGYFLITWDFIRHAREVGIPVGPGRGSAAGSLVAYCLRITDIDPLQYDLLFERFLNPERVTMPDIDIDFCFRRRGEVIDYVTERYGRENVAQIITFGTLAAKAAIRDAGRVLDIPYGEVNEIAKAVPDEIGTRLEEAIRDVPKLKDLYDNDPRIHELLDIAQRIESLSRHAGTHAAGVVITPKPVVEYAPLFKSSKQEITTQWAKDEVEAVGLLKMDFLGLKTLTLITDCLESIKNSEQEVPDIENLALTDEATYALFSRGDTSGVFQFESSGMRDILRRMVPEKFEDLIALNALYRPGPLRSGMIDDFVQRRHGRVKVVYPHPLLEPILEETYGVIVYQEQVMQIASVMAGHSLGGADILRRAMGKKKAEVMEAEGAKFVKGAAERGISEEDARTVFDLMAHFAGYGFNKSHSAAYALVAYQTGYLKAHYLCHFMAALLTNEKDNTDKLVEYMNECRETGLAILPPDINTSSRAFTVAGENEIRFGLAAVKGIGEAAVEGILAARERVGKFKDLDHLCSEVDRKSLNRRVLEALIKSGALDAFGARARLFAAIDGAMERGARAAEDRLSGQESLFGADFAGGPIAPSELPEVEDWSDRERLAGEKEAIGFYITGHPLDDFKEKLEEVTTHRIAELGKGGPTVIGGLITSLRRRRSKNGGEWWAIFHLEDTTGQVECLAFPKVFKEIGERIVEEAAVVVKGIVDAGETRLAVKVEDVKSIDQAELRPASALTIEISSEAEDRDAAIVARLEEVMAGHRGPVPVFFDIRRRGAFRALLEADRRYGVQSGRETISALEAVAGSGKVRLGRP